MTSELIYDVLLKESLNELLSNDILYDEVNTRCHYPPPNLFLPFCIGDYVGVSEVYCV